MDLAALEKDYEEIGKIGASLNYLMELAAVAAILTTIGVVKVEQQWQQKGKYVAIGLWILLLISWQQLVHVPWSRAPKAKGGFTAQADPGWDRKVNQV